MSLMISKICISKAQHAAFIIKAIIYKKSGRTATSVS